MSGPISEALLKQKIEFMQIEIDEFKKKEEHYRRTNECLMQALGTSDSTALESHTAQELKKANEQLEKELSELKSRYREKVSQLEKDKQDLLLQSKELEFTIKQQRLSLETEKLELVSQMQKLESDKLSSEQALKSYEHDKAYQQELLKYQLDNKILDMQKQLELQKELSRNESAKLKQEADSAIFELKTLYEKEIDSLKTQLYQMNEKLRQQSTKMESLREESNPKLMEIRIEELEGELEYYKQSRNRPKKAEEDDSIFISSREEISEIKNMNKSKKTKGNDFEVENLCLQNERLKLQIDRARLEVDQLSNELDRVRTEQLENETQLKNEIKFLIGKLLKAKSKLSIEGDLSETVRRENMLSTLRYKSFSKFKSLSKASAEDEEYY